MNFSNIIDFVRGFMPNGGRYNALSDVSFKEVNNLRFQRYALNWSSYFGLELEGMRAEDRSRSSRVNYLKRNIDKIVYFSFGTGYVATHPRYQKHLDAARLAWGIKRVEKLTRCGQQGSVTGDAFIMVSPKEIAQRMIPDNQPDPDDGKSTMSSQIRVVVIPAEYCTPFYDPFDIDILDKIEIRVPFERSQGTTYKKYVQFIRITKDTIEHGILDADDRILGSSLDAPTGELSSMPNPIGHVYVRHIRNYPAGSSIFGTDDVSEAKVLNEEYTARLTEIGAIINYYSAPITCVYGARAEKLVRGPNKVWGNLPKDGKVEILELKGDLRAATEHLKTLKESLHELMGVPEVAQGSQQAISNTSGVALHTMYLPLIERAVTKQTLYGPEFLEIDILILRWVQALGITSVIDNTTGEVVELEPITDDLVWEDLRQNTVLAFDLPLPKDQLIETQVQGARLQSRIQSRRGALVALGERNPDRVLAEIDEDLEAEAKRAMDAARAQAELTSNVDGDGNLADTAGAGSLDNNDQSVNSGAGAAQGENNTDSGEPKGRPRST
jgi:hypothetical protein